MGGPFIIAAIPERVFSRPHSAFLKAPLLWQHIITTHFSLSLSLSFPCLSPFHAAPSAATAAGGPQETLGNLYSQTDSSRRRRTRGRKRRSLARCFSRLRPLSLSDPDEISRDGAGAVFFSGATRMETREPAERVTAVAGSPSFLPPFFPCQVDVPPPRLLRPPRGDFLTISLYFVCRASATGVGNNSAFGGRNSGARALHLACHLHSNNRRPRPLALARSSHRCSRFYAPLSPRQP